MARTEVTLTNALWDEVFNKNRHHEWDFLKEPKGWSPNHLLLLATLQALHGNYTLADRLLLENLCLGYRGEFIGYFGYYDLCLYILSTRVNDHNVRALALKHLNRLYSLICTCRTKERKVLCPGGRLSTSDDRYLHFKAGYADKEPVSELRDKWLPRLRQWSGDEIWPVRNPYRPLMGLVLMIREGFVPNRNTLIDLTSDYKFTFKKTENGWYAYVAIENAPNGQITAVSEIYGEGTFVTSSGNWFRLRDIEIIEKKLQIISTGKLQAVTQVGVKPIGMVSMWKKSIPKPTGDILQGGIVDRNGLQLL